MLNRFYTKNGLPWDEDPEYKDKDKLKIVNVDASHADEAHEGSKTLCLIWSQTSLLGLGSFSGWILRSDERVN